MGTEGNYDFVNYLRGQQLKAEDVNRIQKWLKNVESKVLPERISISGGEVPNDENKDNYKLHIDTGSEKLYYKKGDDWHAVMPECEVDPNKVAFLKTKRPVAQFLYSSFKDKSGNYLTGQYITVGNKIVKGTTGYVSQLLQIKPGQSFYVGYIENETNIGCFFNAFHEPIKIVTKSDIDTSVKITAKNDSTKTILYKIKNNSDQYEYFCYNLASDENESNRYRQFVVSRQILCLEDSGNYLVYEDDPIYQEKKNKKLCVIGASGVSRNKNVYVGEGLESNSTPRVSIGFQEYLKLWYGNVTSEGRGGHSWRPDYPSGAPTAAGKESIPRSILSDTDLQLETFDDFLFIPSTAGIGSGITAYVGDKTTTYYKAQTNDGKYDSKKISEPSFYFPALGDHTQMLDSIDPSANKVSEVDGGTYFEGLNTLIKIIRKKREGLPTNIYVANGAKKSASYYKSEEHKNDAISIKDNKVSGYTNQAVYRIIEELNRQLELACNLYDYKLIDLTEAGFSRQNYELMTSDKKHLNNEGNRLQGLTIRKQILGF